LQLTGKDLEDRDSRDALRNLLSDIAFAPHAMPQAPTEGIVRVEGAIELDVVRALLPELDQAPVGAATPWLINAQLLGTTIYHDGTKSEVLEQYRSELLSVLHVLNELPLEEFHRVLTTSQNKTLDDALAQVVDALRGAAHLLVE
jgi:hypothetical protein